ncbi:hypothetical protein NL676_039340 [Syzygium grande]|nr:hypothetical protein NL676_039340 [Syzygium grande]
MGYRSRQGVRRSAIRSSFISSQWRSERHLQTDREPFCASVGAGSDDREVGWVIIIIIWIRSGAASSTDGAAEANLRVVIVGDENRRRSVKRENKERMRVQSEAVEFRSDFWGGICLGKTVDVVG